MITLELTEAELIVVGMALAEFRDVMKNKIATGECHADDGQPAIEIAASAWMKTSAAAEKNLDEGFELN